MPIIVRSESHLLTSTPEVRCDMARTIEVFRRLVRMAATVAMTHWPDLGPLRSKERQMALEALLHPTKKRPEVRYPMLGRALGKMPSYLRRAALSQAIGVVSSYLSNYANWLDDEGRERGTRPPRLGYSNVFPSLFGGNMLLVGDKLRTVKIKLLGADGQWRFTAPLKLRGRLRRLTDRMDLSPSLILSGEKARLALPVEVNRPAYMKDKDIDRVCSIDVGINTAATVAIVDKSGTVIARKFITCGRHNDQRDKLAAQVADKQKKSHGGIGKHLGAGFCRALYRRIAGISLDAARTMSSEIAAFTMAHGAKVIVVEALKGWRPKGPSKAMRKRFHRFQHRMLVKYISIKAEEFGMRMMEVYARGTSRLAYDGSGKVFRSKENAQLATFANGRRYNADLNAAYNIAGRGLAMILKLKNATPRLAGNGRSAETGKSTGTASRMPIVLADIWAHYARVSAAAH